MGCLKKLGVSAPVAPVAQEVDRIGDLRAQANSWSYSLGYMVAVSILAELLKSSGRADLAYQVLVKTYNAAGEDRDPEAKGYSKRQQRSTWAGVYSSEGDSTVLYISTMAARRNAIACIRSPRTIVSNVCSEARQVNSQTRLSRLAGMRLCADIRKAGRSGSVRYAARQASAEP